MHVRKFAAVMASGLLVVPLCGEAAEKTFTPNADKRDWNDFVGSGYKSQWKDEALPVTGDSIILSTEKATGSCTLLTHLKRLIVNWPTTVQNYKLTGDNTWILDNRNLNAAAVSYNFGDFSDFYGWIRFNRGDTVSFPGATADNPQVIHRLEPSGRVQLNVATEGAKLTVSNLFGAGTIRKLGAGGLEVVRTGGENVNVDVRQGPVTLHEQEKGKSVDLATVLNKAKVRFDASDETKFEYKDGRVSKWTASASEPNKNYAATEFTTNKYGSAACLKDHNAPLPRRVADYRGTGKAVVDFGPYRDIDSTDLEASGASALQFFDARVNYSEAFIVFADTDPNCRQDVFTDSHNATFRRGTYSSGLSFDGNNYVPHTGAILGEDQAARAARDVRVNGQLVPATFPVGGPNLKVVSIDCVKAGNVQSGESMIGSFGRRDSTHIGGVVVAEFIGFTVSLTDAERQAVNAYLMDKWLPEEERDRADLNNLFVGTEPDVRVPAGESVRVNHLTVDGARLTKDGAGTLGIGDLRCTTNRTLEIAVEDGSLAFVKRRTSSSTSAPAAEPLYHFDVSDPNARTVSDESGKKYVTALKDVNDPSVTAVPITVDKLKLDKTDAGDATAPDRPTLEENVVNGKPVVYLGARTDASGIKSKGYGTASAFLIPSADTTTAGNVFEGFAVIRGAYCIYPFSSTKYTTVFPSAWNLLHQRYSHPARSGEWTVNGIQVNPYEFAFDTAGLSYKYVVIRFSATDRIHVNGIGFQNGTPDGIGGLYLGEWIVYNRRLSEQERRDTEAYLMKKWLNAEHPLDVRSEASVAFGADADAELTVDEDVTLRGVTTETDSFVKRGAGKLTANVPAAATKLDVRAGELDESGVLDGLLGRALLHLDASAEGTVNTNDDGSVTTWTDVRGGSYPYAYHNSERSSLSGFVSANAQNGLPVVDFGDAHVINSAASPYDTYPNPGRAMTFGVNGAEKDLFMREGFLVVKFSTDYPPLLGDYYAFCFHRGACIIDAGINSATNLRYEAEWFVDDARIDVLKYTRATSRETGTGYHVVSFALTNAWTTLTASGQMRSGGDTRTRACSLGQDRAHVAGGIKYGEIVLFDKPLTESERAIMRKHLVEKWATDELAPRALDELRVGAGAGVSLLGSTAVAKLAAGDGASLSGNVSLAANANLELYFNGEGDHSDLTWNGPLDLTAGGTLSIAVSPDFRMPDGVKTLTVPVVTAAGITGSLADWNVAVTPADCRYIVSARISGDRILLTVSRRGMIVIVK